MVLELTPLTRIGRTKPRRELPLFFNRLFRHPIHNATQEAIITPMKTPIEIPMITPIDKEPLEVGEVVLGTGGGAAAALAIHLVCQTLFRR